MRYTLSLSLLLAATALASAPAAAQHIPSPYRFIEERMSLGFETGYLWTGQGDPALGPQSAPLAAVRGLIRIGGPASGEIAVGFAASQRDVFELQPMPGRPDTLVATTLQTRGTPLVLAEAGFRLHLTGPRTWNELAPYASATVGGTFNLGGATEEERQLPTDERFGFGPAFAVGVGVGTDWFVTERVSLRLDARNRLWRLTTPPAFTTTGREEVDWRNNPSLTLGAAYHF
jgi:hypothetical protein